MRSHLETGGNVCVCAHARACCVERASGVLLQSVTTDGKTTLQQKIGFISLIFINCPYITIIIIIIVVCPWLNEYTYTT